MTVKRNKKADAVTVTLVKAVKSLRSNIIFFYLNFLSQAFTIYRTAAEERGYFFNSTPLLPPASQTLGLYPSDYCRELTSAYT